MEILRLFSDNPVLLALPVAAAFGLSLVILVKIFYYIHKSSFEGQPDLKQEFNRRRLDMQKHVIPIEIKKGNASAPRFIAGISMKRIKVHFTAADFAKFAGSSSQQASRSRSPVEDDR